MKHIYPSRMRKSSTKMTKFVEPPIVGISIDPKHHNNPNQMVQRQQMNFCQMREQLVFSIDKTQSKSLEEIEPDTSLESRGLRQDKYACPK